MAQGALPFQYEAETAASGVTAQAPPAKAAAPSMTAGSWAASLPPTRPHS